MSEAHLLKDNKAITKWSKDELRRIAETNDLHVSPFREDGVTYGTPTWIWSVVVDDALYVRAYNGQNSLINDRIDNAYGAKYRGSAYVKDMIGARARAATVRIVPHESASRAE